MGRRAEPGHRDLAGFDFTASEVNEATVRQLHRCEFLEGAHNFVLIGGPGTGKTHLATALGVQAVEHHRKKVRFFSTVELVNTLEQEKAKGKGGQIGDSHPRPTSIASMHPSRALRKASRCFRLGVIVGELEHGTGQARHLDGIERHEQLLNDLAAAMGIDWHQILARPVQIQQNRVALEDRDVSVGKPWNIGGGSSRRLIPDPYRSQHLAGSYPSRAMLRCRNRVCNIHLRPYLRVGLGFQLYPEQAMPGTLVSAHLPPPLRLLKEHEDLGLLRSHLKIHYRSLGPRSRRLRFMGDPSPEALDRLADRADPVLVLELVEDESIRAVLEAYPASPGHAEVAISVEDAYQGKGLGRALFEEGLIVLASHGYRTADLFCLRENTALLHLVSRTGARMRMADGEVHVAIELDRVLDHLGPSASQRSS